MPAADIMTSSILPVQEDAPPLNDAAICERLTSELVAMPWAAENLIEIIACEGIVDLWGSIVDERARKRLIAAAETIPGVKAVRDRLVCVESRSDVATETTADVSLLAQAS